MSWMKIFDLIACAYIIIAVHTGCALRRNWSSFIDNTVTRDDETLVHKVVFCFFIPLGVLLHETGHALAVWWFHGRVIGFHWHIYWGYVSYAGTLSSLQSWIVSLSGNVVSVLFGLAPLLFMQSYGRPIIRSLLKSLAFQQLVYSLAWYPAISFLSPKFKSGDWVKIYNFNTIPYAYFVLIVHALLLIYLWRLMKQGRFSV